MSTSKPPSGGFFIIIPIFTVCWFCINICMKYILMIKKCMNTGLMYLCKTTSNCKKNPYEYTGSGKRWKLHIKKHNSYIMTCIIGEYDTIEELVNNGQKFSDEFNVVESEQWANIIPERGDGGLIHDQTGNRWKVKDSSKMGKHKNQWINDDGTRAATQSKRMKNNNPSHLKPHTTKQIEAARINSRKATEKSKKQIKIIDADDNEMLFESKRAATKFLGVSYDVLNYRIKTGMMYNQYKIFEVKT